MCNRRVLECMSELLIECYSDSCYLLPFILYFRKHLFFLVRKTVKRSAKSSSVFMHKIVQFRK